MILTSRFTSELLFVSFERLEDKLFEFEEMFEEFAPLVVVIAFPETAFEFESPLVVLMFSSVRFSSISLRRATTFLQPLTWSLFSLKREKRG